MCNFTHTTKTKCQHTVTEQYTVPYHLPTLSLGQRIHRQTKLLLLTEPDPALQKLSRLVNFSPEVCG